MQGLSLQSLKKHKAAVNVLELSKYLIKITTNPGGTWYIQLIPLYVCTALGCGGAVFYLLRLATRNPEVTWSRKNNPEPWEEYRAKQYKFYSPKTDGSAESPAPKY